MPPQSILLPVVISLDRVRRPVRSTGLKVVRSGRYGPRNLPASPFGIRCWFPSRRSLFRVFWSLLPVLIFEFLILGTKFGKPGKVVIQFRTVITNV